MLRASSEYKGESVDVGMLTRGARGNVPGLVAAKELLDFTTAASSGDAGAIAAARDGVTTALGAEATVHAAAIIGNFERMTRIADATGIPVDAPVNMLASQIQDDLGLRSFRSAAASRRANPLAVGVMKVFRPLVLRLMPAVAKYVRRSVERERSARS